MSSSSTPFPEDDPEVAPLVDESPEAPVEEPIRTARAEGGSGGANGGGG